MAENKGSSDASAEKAYAAAASELKAQDSQGKEDRPVGPPDQASVTPSEPAEKKPGTSAPEANTAETNTRAPAKSEAAPKKAAPKKTAATRRAASEKASAPAKPAARNQLEPTLNELKEKIMAKNTDATETITRSMNEAVTEMQSKAQEAYTKGTAMVSEMTEIAKGNAEALVESGKIMAAGVQDMGKTYAEEAKTAYETLTADMKEMAAVKSPTELFQLQGKIMRRNFDMLIATSSKNTEAAMKLANDAIAPLSSRVNVTVEKMSKAA